MTDEEFRSACNVFGFAPSRALRELLDSTTAQAVIAEREACAVYLERGIDLGGLAGHPGWQNYTADLLAGCAAAIRARSNK